MKGDFSAYAIGDCLNAFDVCSDARVRASLLAIARHLVEETHFVMYSTQEFEENCFDDVKIPQRGEGGADFEYTHRLAGLEYECHI